MECRRNLQAEQPLKTLLSGARNTACTRSGQARTCRLSARSSAADEADVMASVSFEHQEEVKLTLAPTFDYRKKGLSDGKSAFGGHNANWRLGAASSVIKRQSWA